MLIAINTRLLLANSEDGIGRFSYEILKRITVQNKQHKFIFIFDRKFDEKFIFSDNIIPIVISPQARHPILWFFFFEFSVTRILNKYKPDLFISTDGWLSLTTKTKSLQVLHDLHFKVCPYYLPFLVKKYYTYFFPKFIKKATQIITVSNYCKTEIIKEYNKLEQAIDVVYNSTRENYKAIENEKRISVKKIFTNSQDYFLFIGPIHERKNLKNIIDAFILFKQKTKSLMKLVVTGKKMWNKALDVNWHQDIIYTGYLNEDELYNITASAFCLVYASFYEGFGIPILEAMSCGVPVITSNTSAMPEIAKDAAILVDPNSTTCIANAMIHISDNDSLKQKLIENGYENLKRFSWDNSANNFWEIILKTITKN